MNVGTITCLIMAALFLLMGIAFVLLGEKGAMMVSGFNTLPKEKREQYDAEKLSADQRNKFFLWCALFAAGAGLTHLLSPYLAFAVFAVWLVLFFREVHLDSDKAFKKYEKQ